MTNTDAWLSLNQEVIRQLTQRHDWRLLDEETFAHLLATRVQTTSMPDRDRVDREILTKLAVNLYCETWHAACYGESDRRERAYTELAHYLYDRALHKYGDVEMAQEITHDAIILVAEQIDSCRKPGAFLAFALLKLWNAATTYFRQRDRRRARTEPLPEHGEISQLQRATASHMRSHTGTSPEQHAVTADHAAALLTRVAELMQQAPRARNQFQAVLLKFLYAYSDEEIAQTMETEVQNVHVLRSRGLKRMRDDPVLRQLYVERGER